MQNFLTLDEITDSGSCETKRPDLSDCLVEVDQLTVKWPSIEEEETEGNTLTDFSLTVRPGQLLIVVGQVGAGKVLQTANLNNGDFKLI